MKVIWKAPIGEIRHEWRIGMPRGAVIRSVQVQNGMATVWFECDPDERIVQRRILISGTGHSVPSKHNGDSAPYIGTVQIGEFVWHLWDGGEA